MYTLLLFINLGLSLAAFSAQEHAVYIAVIEISHASDATQAQLKIKLFRDDFVNALSNVSGSFEDINTDLNCTSKQTEIQEYFDNHLDCTINSGSYTPHLLQCEVMPEVVWLTFSLHGPAEWQSFRLRADFLMELFPDQMHMVMLESAGKKWSFRLDAAQKERHLNLE